MRMTSPFVPLLAAALLGPPCGCKDDPKPPPPAPPKPGTERLALVTATASPLLPKPDKNKSALDTLHAGDLVYAVSPVTEKGYDVVEWTGVLDGAEEHHGGQTFLVHRAHGDGPLYGFRVDFPSEIDVPERGFVCAAIGRGRGERSADLGACADRLRRAQLPSGALVAYVPCQTGACPVAAVEGDVAQVLVVDGLVDARPLALPDGGGDALLATTRFVRADGTWTGAELVVVGFAGGAPVRRGSLPLDEIDARGATEVKNRIVTAAVRGTDVHLTGESRRVVRSDGTELSKEAVDERYHLTPDGTFVR
ncbi:MAG: hypothetical protein IT373_26805 [Polyangiaceae bacterium]|nr:hypothetical protein [Polyangiaceae bacterium]